MPTLQQPPGQRSFLRSISHGMTINKTASSSTLGGAKHTRLPRSTQRVIATLLAAVVVCATSPTPAYAATSSFTGVPSASN